MAEGVQNRDVTQSRGQGGGRGSLLGEVWKVGTFVSSNENGKGEGPSGQGKSKSERVS